MPHRLIVLFVLLLSATYLTLLGAETAADSTLAGTVLDENAEPVHASVTAFRLKVAMGVLTPTPACMTQTDPDGRFACPRLTAGAYVLLVKPQNSSPPSPRNSLRKGALGTSHPRFVIYPYVYGGSAADLLHLGAGQTQWAEVTVNDDSLHKIRIQSPPGAEGTRVQVFWQAGDFVIPVFDANEEVDRSGDDYKVVTGVPSGAYSIVVKSWMAHGQKHEAHGSVNVDEFSQNTVTLKDAGSYDISGSVKIAPESSLYSQDAHPKSAIGTVVLNSVAQDIPRSYAASPNRSGSFVFKDVAAGEYDVSVDGASGFYVSEISVGQRREENTTIDVDENIADVPVTLTASPASASISGFVELEGKEVKPGILIHSLESGANRIMSVKKDGSFLAKGLAPGVYLLYGWEDIDNVPYRSPRFLERYKRNALEVNLDADSNLTGLDVECNDVDF